MSTLRLYSPHRASVARRPVRTDALVGLVITPSRPKGLAGGI